MLEFLLCSLITILPYYLFRRHYSGKRWGHDITFFTMWYELRWGITACILLTVALITLIFYYHPSTTHVAPMFRTVTILPEAGGRVKEVFVTNHQLVEAGEPLFSIEESSQLAAVEQARAALQAVEAEFSLAAPIIKPGSLAELTCFSKPFTIVPMVVTAVQPMIAAGQIRPTDQLIDLQDRARPGTLSVMMEPLYENGMDGIPPGSKCIANAYSNHHEMLTSGEVGTGAYLYYHMVDAVGIVHAVILRIQALLIPVKLLVFSGH